MSSQYDRMLLRRAACTGNLKMIKKLIDFKHIDADHGGINDMSLLQLAATNGHTHIVEFLCANGADMEGSNDFFQSTALHLAAASGHTSVISLLLDRGAHIDALNRDCETPLYVAIR